MYISGKKTTEFNFEDILNLKENRVGESKILDYKRDFYDFKSNDDKREFLFDITAMANTEGGCLVFGIEEEKGLNNIGSISLTM